MGIINFIIEGRAEALYDRLEDVILSTRDVDLRRYGLVMMAAARDDELGERLLRHGQAGAPGRPAALSLTPLKSATCRERDETLATIRRRL